MAQQANGAMLVVQRTGLTRYNGARLGVFRTEYRHTTSGAGQDQSQLAVNLVILEPERDARRELVVVGDRVTVGGDSLRVESITSKQDGGPLAVLRRAA